MFERIKSQLEIFSNQANQLNVAFLSQKVKGTIKLLKQPECVEFRDKNINLIVLLSGMASAFIGLFLAFFWEYIRQANKPVVSDNS